MKYADMIVGLIIAVIGLVMVLLAAALPTVPTADVGPGFFPKAIGYLLLGLGVLLAGKSFITNQDKESWKQIFHKGSWTALLVMVVFGGYVFLLPILGFLISTPILIIGLSLLLKATNKIAVVVTGLAVTFALYYVFLKVLLIPLPSGIIL
ncbi:tripartite tricarboxylate transporter TctB family protein [Bacillus horti]|uniref:tripartite tricarboxylate transporter TctB family protein n=1 Tax=Caldalkalibacillus horti TaxID=77523 RepID=UPI0027D8E748|nr:tripartite tricarboxylate transporter TctB family protein [Bacillus horti]